MFLVDRVEDALKPLTFELVTNCLTCGDPIIYGFAEVGRLPFKVCRDCIYEAAIAMGYCERMEDPA